MVWIIGILISGLLLWSLGILFTGILQDYFIFLPKKLDAGFQFQFTNPFESFLLKTENNGKVFGLWFKEGNKRSKKGLILYAHGNKGNLKRWGHYHFYFKKAGFDFMIYDYRGFGKSTGPRNEINLYLDALEVYNFAKKHYPEHKIIVYGRSMGSTFASKMAAENQPAGLILETPFSGMKDLFYCYFPFFPKIFLFKYHFDNKVLLQKVNCPVLIFQGTKDRIVPLHSAIQLKPFLKQGDKFVVIENGNHHNLMHFENYGTEIDSFLKKITQAGKAIP
jgi:alpha-beta hydrolase superfamily lysophospholipase